MFEQAWPADRIVSYWKRFDQCINQVRAAFVSLSLSHAPAASQVLRSHTVQVRGDSWAKIARHVEQAPAGRALSSEVFEVPIEFWVRYRHLCDALIAETTVPVLAVDTSNGWEKVASRVVRWLDGIGTEPKV